MRKGQNAGRRRRPASRFHSPSSAIIITHAVYLRLGITSPLAAGNRPLASVLSRSSAVVYNHARIPRLLIPFYHGKHETNDCRYRSTRLLNARQNQNGRGRQRETWRVYLQYKLETISRVYTNCYRPGYRPFIRLPTQFRPIIVQQMTRDFPSTVSFFPSEFR